MININKMLIRYQFCTCIVYARLIILDNHQNLVVAFTPYNKLPKKCTKNQNETLKFDVTTSYNCQ